MRRKDGKNELTNGAPKNVNNSAQRAVRRSDTATAVDAASGADPQWVEKALRQLQQCGVVGMGGAGFPAHVKYKAAVDTVLVNGAECEPLLWADKSLLLGWADEVFDGLELVMRLTGASRGVLAIKRGYLEVRETVESALARRALPARQAMEVYLLPNVYPAGDEFVLVQQVLGRTIPELGLPLDVGVVVGNVATMRAASRALCHDEPLTDRLVTVLGEVAAPKTLNAPVGTPIGDLVAAAGGATRNDCYYVVGGAMMGALTRDGSEPLRKTTSGLFVLPPHHTVVRRHLQDPATGLRLAKAACCQCMQCSEVCPRNALGHRLYPDRLMRSLAAGVTHDLQAFTGAFFCCECGLCTVYGCPMYLDPCGMNIQIKKRLRAAGIASEKQPTSRPDPFFAIKQVPLSRLVARLELMPYAVDARLDETPVQPQRVQLPLKQGVGAAAKPVVEPGQRVSKGQRVAEPDGALSAALHASISGVVKTLTSETVVVERSESERKR
jgi:Na+-translocating ferredoxin:NAD+ oxidoreductase RnfC subunit